MNTTEKHIDPTKASAGYSPLRLLLAAGGTGGHVYPAIAIADAVQELQPDSEILFVGTRDRMEWEAVPKSGYPIKSVWISGFHRRLTPQNLLFPVKLVVSLFQSFSIVKRFKPDLLVACGGFAAGPVGWVAAKLGVPLVIQEQNSFPGVTNRILAKHASKIFTAFEAADEYFPKGKTELAGNPVRSILSVSDRTKALQKFGFTEEKPVLLVLGGSGGARALNEAMAASIHYLHDELKLQIIWQCGPAYIKDLENRVDNERYPNLKLLSYIDDMAAAYGAATLVLTRAGASTCSELMMIGKPSVLVPSPNVAGDHQTKNAKAMADRGASVLIEEENLEQTMKRVLSELIIHKDRLSEMATAARKLAKPNAAKTIARYLFERAKSK